MICRLELIHDRAGSVELVAPADLDLSAEVMYVTNCPCPIEVHKSSTRLSGWCRTMNLLSAPNYMADGNFKSERLGCVVDQAFMPG